jgi:hypothetical protein
MKLFKATYIYYDNTRTSLYKKGHEIYINSDQIVKIEEKYLGTVEKEDGIGTVYSVTTNVDDGPYTITCISAYLDEQIKGLGAPKKKKAT